MPEKENNELHFYFTDLVETMHKDEEFFNSNEIKKQYFNLVLDYSDGYLLLFHIIPFLTKNDLFNLYLTNKKIANLIQQQNIYSFQLQVNENNLLKLKDYFNINNNRNHLQNNRVEKINCNTTFPSILPFTNGLQLNLYNVITKRLQSNIKEFVNFFYKYIFLQQQTKEVTFILECTSYESYYVIPDIMNLLIEIINNDLDLKENEYLNLNLKFYIEFSNEKLSSELLKLFNQLQNIKFNTLTFELNGVDYILNFVKDCSSLQSLNIQTINIKINNSCSSFDVLCLFIEKFSNKIKFNIEADAFRFIDISSIKFFIKLMKFRNIFIYGKLYINWINFTQSHLQSNEVEQIDIVKLFTYLQKFSIKEIHIENSSLITKSSLTNFNLNKLQSFTCKKTTFYKINDKLEKIDITKEFLDIFKFENIKYLHFENLQLQQAPISLNNNVHLKTIILKNNNIGNLDNLIKVDGLAFIDLEDNKIDDIEVLNKFRNINLKGNKKVLYNNIIGYYNDKYFIINPEEYLFKQYFQTNLIEIYLFNFMQYVKIIKKKNRNTKIQPISSRKNLLQFLELKNFKNILDNTYYFEAFSTLQQNLPHSIKFYLNILYTPPDKEEYDYFTKESIV
ncbi:hypothetical protein ABK040_007391 [Willaertia magna]